MIESEFRSLVRGCFSSSDLVHEYRADAESGFDDQGREILLISVEQLFKGGHLLAELRHEPPLRADKSQIRPCHVRYGGIASVAELDRPKSEFVQSGIDFRGDKSTRDK